MITPIINFNQRGYFSILLVLASTSFLFGNGNDPCTASAAQGAGHAIWLSKYNNGKHASFYFDDQGGNLLENQDGTAHVYGTLYNNKDPQDQWEVQLWLSDRMNWDEWSALGRKYKDQNNKAGNLYKTWSYYIMDPNKNSMLVGKGKNEGTTVPIKHNPIDYSYGFQVGQAGNDKNKNFGFSGWFLYYINGDEPRQGDFNFDLSCPTITPDDCPDCFSSKLLSTSQTNEGCTTYSLEISNDGSCRHALSHYTVDIPCGTVSNISNSEGWKVEVGKDPTTGLNGFKIDDINGFGESNQPGSFKIEFTICPDGSTCGEQNCWDAKIAHKAGQCITSEVMSLCDQPASDPTSNISEATNCLALAAEGGGHATWMGKYLNGTNAQFQFDQNGGSVQQHPDGTGHISGIIYLPENPEDQWEVDVWMSDRKNWEEWAATGGSYKGDENIIGDLYKTWSYYILDPNKQNRLIGIGKNEGETLYLQHYPVNHEYAVQVGNGSNDKNSHFGLSIWFTYERNNQLWRGDFNFDLNCEAVDTPPDCDVNELAAEFETSDVSCYSAQDGSANVTVTGGFAPFSFAWSNGATSQDLMSLGGGNYSVTITDANDATLQLSGTVFEPSQLTLNGITSPLSCGAVNGSIALSVSGGTSPYSYSWSNGGTERDLTGLNADTYQVTVTDANECFIIEEFVLMATSNISAIITTNTCNDGSLVLDIVGGVPPYNFLWSTGETIKDIIVGVTGTYDVTVTDENGCSAVSSITVNNLTTFELSVQPTVPSCGGNADGAIDLSINGGQTPFTYSWSNGTTTQDLSNVASGSYTVTVTDGRDCSQELTHFLRNPVSIFISTKVDLIRCDGNGADGAIDISIFNAAAPYTVSWSHGATSEDISGLAPGVYTLSVTDANGCQGTKTIELTAPEDFEVDLTQQYCGDGRICPTLNGGSGPFTYSWTDDGGNSISTIDGCIEVTEAGIYTVDVVDVNGCIKSASITVGAPNPSLSTSLTVSDVTCAGGNNGTASVSITGGDGNYTILWSNGMSTTSINGLVAKSYTVKVTDGNGCQEFRAFNIQEPQGLEISVSTITEDSCKGESDGAIDIMVANGTAPYSYQWSDGSTSEDLTAAAAGTYSVTISDANGCSTVMSYELMVNPDNTNCDNGNGDGGNTGGGDSGGDGSGDGNGDGTTDPCIRDCNTCDGKITELTLKYLGDEPNAQIIVKQKNGGQVVFDQIVAPEGEFSFIGMDNKGSLSSEITISINGIEETTIHTSCSQPIGPGLISGQFEVLAGESRNGGPLCPIDPDTKQELEEEVVEEPQGQDCAECHESELISVAETKEGCLTYTLEVFNNGSCAHALSHYSVRIPCGIVTEASNSGGWPMELNSKDPHTNLYGLKVDDIHGFSENGQEGSFTLTYTVCPNQNDDCKVKLQSENIIVGYKAAQCAKIETIELNDQVANFDQEEDNIPLTFIKFSVYPNPVKSGGPTTLSLEFQEANIGEQLLVKVMGVTGRSIYAKRLEISRENEVLPLRLAGMSPGVYFVTITSHHKVYTEKIIIK